jgi:iron(III) transport system ATP-binding protein
MLDVRRLTKYFAGPGGRRHAAVQDLSLTIEDGSFCTLLGPSGCGKTTLLRMIAGFEEPSSGDVLHNGRSILAVPPYRRGFPMVFQSYALFPHLTVRDNVMYGLRMRQLSAGERTSRVEQALLLLGLADQRDKHPAQLSGGQQQRVALARCLVLEPEMILLDEPLSNLDAALRLEMRREIRSLQQRLGITALYVTHDQEEALAVSDRIIVMNEGRVEQDGSPGDVFHQPRTRFVARFMGAPNIVPVAAYHDGSGELLGRVYDLRHASRPPDLQQPAYAVIRSDAVLLRSDGAHRGRVSVSTFLGHRVQHVLELEDGSTLVVEEPASWPAHDRTGQDTAFDLVPERIHLLRD